MIRRLAIAAGLRCLLPLCLAGPLIATAPSVEVRGYGLFGNRSLARIAEIVRGAPETAGPDLPFDTIELENLLLLINARVERDGYGAASYQVSLTAADGRTWDATWDTRAWLDWPTGFPVAQVRIEVRKGVRRWYRNISLPDLEMLPRRETLGFFYPTGPLFRRRADRVYSPHGLRAALDNIVTELRERGYRDARAGSADLNIDTASGAVDLTVAIDPGRRYLVTGIDERVAGGAPWPAGVAAAPPLAAPLPWSPALQSRRLREALNRLHRAGYPEAAGRTEIEPADAAAAAPTLRLHLILAPGPRLRTGDVHISGSPRTRQSMLDRRLRLQSGDWLDILEIEQARFRMGRLGAFRSIDTALTPSGHGDDYRDVQFILQEDKRINLSLLLGYGSYEKLRAGIEMDRRHLWGRAHHDRLRFTQSFKSSSGSYRYQMPEIFGETISVSAGGDALLREELSFQREEWGAELRLFKALSSQTQASIAYRFEQLRSTGLDFQNTGSDVLENRAGNIQLTLARDLRDNPVWPAKGGQVRIEAEFGEPAIGAGTPYQRFTMLWSRHQALRSGLLLHLRLSHGALTAWGGDATAVSPNKRFFPGGSQSIRGYRQGGASPRDAAGNHIGAATFTLAQIELEQQLGTNLSGVLFYDRLWFAESIDDYPSAESLDSIGIGLRYRTLIGPLRVELGWNPQPRPLDPDYAVQISLGMPF